MRAVKSHGKDITLRRASDVMNTHLSDPANRIRLFHATSPWNVLEQKFVVRRAVDTMAG
jgi:hypothetical protein